MKENVIIVNCKVPSEAYQILSMLRQDHDNESFTISQAAVVKKDAGHLSLEDAFVSGGATEARGWTGGLIGGLVGLLAGPLGVLLGAGIGSLIGDSMDLKELEGKSALLEKASECLVDGETALLLMVKEEDETALGAMLKDFQISITRMDAAEVASEIESTKKQEQLTAAARAMAEEASKAPDYSKKECWYQIPEITKDVDTFYICATEYIMSSLEEGAPDYATLDNPEMLFGAKVEYRDHASAYADSTNVFVPYTRQSGLRYAGEIHKRDGNIDAALLGVPYEDITAALDYYFENCNGGRPFIIAGHSQGSAMALLLLRTYFKDHPEYYSRMVAAYTIGYSVTDEYLADNPHLKFAAGESDTGVIIAWNTEGPKNVEANAHSVVVLPNTRSINPLNWKLDETYAPASLNLGSIILDEKTGEPSIGDVGADAQINLARGTVVTNAKADPMPEDVAKVAADFFGPDGRHGSDYMYYYNNIKANVAKRVAAYLASR
jgi:uncharacterized membrane protein